MSKVLRVAAICLLGIALATGPSMAGPGGRNGDPDHPQIANPSGRTPALAEPASTFGNGVVSSEQQLPELWQRVIRVYLRLQGVRVR